MIKFRNSAIAGVTAVAIVAAGSLGTATQAQAGGKLAAGIIGGLAVGAFIGAASAHAHGYPAYYGPTCQFQKQKVWNPAYGAYTWQTVKVCY